jgi:FKBP-type peptidyl-prolyl cis-trans isomerase
MVRRIVVFLAAVITAACSGSDTGTSPTILPGAPYSQTDLVVGTGAEAVPGRRVSVHYSGWLYDPVAAENKGARFDTSAGREPFAFNLGTGAVIQGFDRGVTGMRVGGRRRVVVPPDLGYGSAGSQGVIPPGATLVFEMELVTVS